MTIVGAFVLVAVAVGMWIALGEHQGQQPSNVRRIESAAFVVLFAGMLLAILMQVGIRYFLHAYFRLPWTDEIARFFLVWAVFLGVVSLFRTNKLIEMPLFVSRLRGAAAQAANALAAVLVFWILLVLVTAGWDAATRAQAMRLIALPGTRAWFAYAVPASAALMLIVMGWRLATAVLRRKPSRQLSDPP